MIYFSFQSCDPAAWIDYLLNPSTSGGKKRKDGKKSFKRDRKYAFLEEQVISIKPFCLPLCCTTIALTHRFYTCCSV